jgi:predicted nucleotidyltransferase
MDEDALAVERLQYQRALAQTVADVVTALGHRPEVQRAILFGSYAEGRRDLFTDLDILIVMESPLSFIARTAEMYQYLTAPVDMDLLVYTPEELRRHRDRGFIRQALEKGTTIYEKPPD